MTTLLLTLAAGRTFFVAPGGDDANDGLAQARAWRTLARASQAPLAPGDEIVLAGGATFTGSLDLKTPGGPGERPVVVRSGGKPATIVSPERTGITVHGGGVTIRDLILRGEAKAAKKGHGGIAVLAPGDRRQPPVRIERVNVSGFGDSGIGVGSDADVPHGFDGIAILKSDVSGNFGTGIITWDKSAQVRKGYAHRNLEIVDCEASRNLGGSGIIVAGVDGGRVEFCRSVDNLGPGGGVGIWAWCARGIRFRHCIAGGTRTGGKDGGGFDLDGGTEDCVVERCLTFDNDGPGYMHCDYPAAPPTRRNAIRDSVSLDDGRKKGGDAIGFGFVTWGSGLTDCVVERNVAVVRPDATGGHEFGAMFAYYIRSSADPVEEQKIRSCVFRNNLVEIRGRGPAFVRDDLPVREPGDLIYQGNGYVSPGKPAFIEGEKGERRFATVEEWRKANPSDARPDVRPTRIVDRLGDPRKLHPRDLPKRLGGLR